MHRTFSLSSTLLCFSLACFSIAAWVRKNLHRCKLYFFFKYYINVIYLQQLAHAHLTAVSAWSSFKCWLRSYFLPCPVKILSQNWHFSTLLFKLVEISPLWHSSKCACCPMAASIYMSHSLHFKNFFSGCFQSMCRYMALCVWCIDPHTKHLKFFFPASVQRCIWNRVSFFIFSSHGLIIFPLEIILIL
jgi:hypothetical protein